MISRSLFVSLRRPATIGLNQISKNNFGVVSMIKNQITSGSIYRGIGIVASIQLIATYAGTYFFERGVTMSIQDYRENRFIKENQQFQIAAIIKPGSFQVKRGTLETKFVLTDFENDVEVFYRGQTKFEFKEGETLVLTAYLPDINNKSKIIGIDYLTKHSMDGTNWENRIESSRQNFGVQTRLQPII